MTVHRDRHWRLLALMLLCMALQFVGLAAPASADGKYYAPGRPVGLVYQRAAISFDGEREVLMVQSRYQGDQDGPLSDLGWVVPVPAVPRIGAVDAESAHEAFSALLQATQLTEIRVSDYFVWLLMGIAVLGLVRLPLAIAIALRNRFAKSAWPTTIWVGTIKGNLMLLLLPLFALLIVPQFSSYTRKGDGVRVLKEQTVGHLVVRVVSADGARELLDWLKANQFSHDQADIAAIESYVARRWVFVTAKPVAGARPEQLVGKYGMLAPLLLSFPTKVAVYPLALTATASELTGRPTYIDLVVFSTGKMDAGGRMSMKYADRKPGKTLADFVGRVEPAGFLQQELTARENYITRFAAPMTAKDMHLDLELRPAADDEPYTRLVRW